MLRHNLLLIYRNFKRFKTTFFINLIGLSTGLACTLLIYLWVSDEWNVDKFHKKDARLFEVMEHQQHTGSIRVTNSTPGLLAETLAEEMPEVEYVAVATPSYWFDKFTLSIKQDKQIDANGIYASKDYFNVFSFDLILGDANRVLADKNSIVISESIAKNLFDTPANALGKAVECQHEKQYTVSGIFKNIPSNSSAQFDFVLSFEVAKEINPGIAKWENSGPMTFVVLKEGTNKNQFDKKIADLIKHKSKDTHRTLFTTRYSDVYLYGEYVNGEQSGGRIDYVKQFSIIAFFILVIACINFMNLSTAKASRRIKEVGIKKAVGAGRRMLIAQYLGESMLMSLLSLATAILIVDLCLPKFNEITGKALILNFDGNFALSIAGIMLFTGLIAGSYPALYLSGFSPASVLKGKLTTSFGDAWARKGLVIFQFTLSVILIVAVLVVYKQIEFLQQKNLGYNKDNLIYFEMEGKIKEHAETFISELKNIPGIVNASSIAQSMVGGGNTSEIEWEGKNPDEKIPFAIRPVNYDAIEMMDIEVKEGRSFSRKFSGDSLKVVFNEAAIKAMALKDPIGKEVSLGPYKFQIIGIVKDFHFESLHTNINPLFFVMRPEFTQKIIAKIRAGKEAETIESIRKFYQAFNPGFAFDYRFVDQDYRAQYDAEQKVATLSNYFASLAILISCLGLFGLAAFTAERRLKEVGIRKVLGASEWRIIYLLSGDFTKIVFIAIVLAIPVSYVITRQWLDGFAYKISLAWWYFIGAGFLALLIAWLTVGSQALKAARVNPTQCLKDE
jgi:putative ABC transport system permease protein